jgi:hypothetical protein
MKTHRRAAMPTLLGAVALAALAGCTSSQGLDVRYPAEGVNRALLATVPARRVTIGPVVDRRLDTSRIGTQPKNGQDIVTSRPVNDIVRDAFAAELSRNGHTVLAGGTDVVLTAEVEEFWLDVVVGYPRAQYVGKVVLALAVVDGANGRTLFARRYAGIKRQEADAKATDVGRDVMDAALARTMHDFATDPQMVAAFGGRRS